MATCPAIVWQLIPPCPAAIDNLILHYCFAVVASCMMLYIA